MRCSTASPPFPPSSATICHGEVVSYGVLVQLVMDKDSEQLDFLMPLYRKLGLPTCLADLGLTVEDDFDEALAAESTRSSAVMPLSSHPEIFITAGDRLVLEDAGAATSPHLRPVLPG